MSVPDLVFDQLTLYVLGGLSPDEARVVEAHLRTDWAVYAGELAKLRRTLGELALAPESVEPPARLRDQVLARFDAERTSRHLPSGFVHVPASDADWLPLGSGTWVRVLHVDAATGSLTMLIRMEPGALISGHLHAEAEEIFIISGDCQVTPGLVLRAGDYFRAEAGSPHEWVSSERGTLFLARARNEDLPA